MTPQEYCQQKTKESHSNFLTAFIFLKKEKPSNLNADEGLVMYRSLPIRNKNCEKACDISNKE